MFPEVLVDVLERVDLVAGQEQATKVSVPEVTEDEDFCTIMFHLRAWFFTNLALISSTLTPSPNDYKLESIRQRAAGLVQIVALQQCYIKRPF